MTAAGDAAVWGRSFTEFLPSYALLSPNSLQVRVLLGFIGSHLFFNGFPLGLIGFYRVSLVLSVVLLGCNEFLMGFDWVCLGFTGF